MIPLLPPGLHEMSIAELRHLCVDDFRDSNGRVYLADALEELIEALADVGMSCEAWIDGSFVTSKLDPADVDVVFVIDDEVVDASDEEALVLIDRISRNLRDENRLDTYIAVRYPSRHPRFAYGMEYIRHWREAFGYDRSGQQKGIAVIRIGGPR